MKQERIGLSRRYATALRQHLKSGNSANQPLAWRLGRDAVALGLTTLELARMHERALAAIEPVSGISSQPALRQRAGTFFEEVNSPIEATHRATRPAQDRATRLEETLGERTRELAVAHRQLRQGVGRRKAMAKALAKSGKDRDVRLTESLQLQKRLRQLTHRVIAAQEVERSTISHELQDEIAQTLLGINVRLLSLKQAARSDTQGLKNQLASVQRLVVKSAKSVRRFARKLDTSQPGSGTRSNAARRR
jgi:signal transduction histidine kinase